MTEQELLIHTFESDIFKKWHWYRFHFEQHLRGGSHSFSTSIVRACLDCDHHIPGIAQGMVDELAAISGREKGQEHYEQLLQRLAELLVIRQVVTYPWKFNAVFRWEPTVAGSRKNPELLVEGGPLPIGVEVKAPALLDHQKKRRKNPTQLLSRVMSKGDSAEGEKGTQLVSRRSSRFDHCEMRCIPFSAPRKPESGRSTPRPAPFSTPVLAPKR